jgi:LytS/YehU family sensor histidine kinase
LSLWANLSTFTFYLLVYLCTWSTCYFLLHPLRNRFGSRYNPFAKMLLFCLITAVICSVALWNAGGLWSQWAPYQVTAQMIELTIDYSASASVLFALAFEVAYLSIERSEQQQKAIELKREKQEAELHALRNELDPHFMFNSLNTLHYLIRSDKDKASEYNARLAQVYQYYLEHKDKDLVPLERELAFVQNYFQLLQMRFGTALKLEIEPPGGEVHYVVPGSLQLALENAIKHNRFSEQEPLWVHLQIADDAVLVENSFRPKPFTATSTGIGLKNINEQYELISGRSIGVQKSAGHFTVSFPLLSNIPTI